ncbi:MAG: hypothetical protein M3R30_10165, partial [Candidatus Eremiobacteraeota bacterium]|nr:hypothetical protein [Candidatus Eremiobacteraeota bacterium]
LEREVSDVKLSLNGDGFVTNFQTTGDMKIVDGSMESMKLVNDNMSGLVNFAWSAAKKSKGVYGLDPSDSVVELPCAFETPLVIGGLPFTLCITESFFIRPGLTSSTIAHGKFHAQYSGSQGISVGSGAVSEDGSPQQTSAVDDSMSTSLIPTGFVAAIAMPKVELKTGPADVLHELSEIAHGAPQSFAEKAAGALAKTSLGKKIVDATKSAFDSGIGAYVELILSTGMTGSGSMGVTTCTQTTFLVTFKAKAEAKLLGVKIAATGDEAATKELYKSFTADPDTPFCRGTSTGG